MATFQSNTYTNGRVLTLSVTQSGKYLNWTLTASGAASNSLVTVYNIKITINNTIVYNPGTVYVSSGKFPAAIGSTSGSVDIGDSAQSRQIPVSFIGAVYYNRSTENAGPVTASPTIYKSTLSDVTISDKGDKSFKAAFSVVNNNGQAPIMKNLEISYYSNFSSIVDSEDAYSNTFTGLFPNRKYYVKGETVNAAGTSETNVASYTTAFYKPSTPASASITDTDEIIPTKTIKCDWATASNGSTAVAGYRFRLFKNGTEMMVEDTDSTVSYKEISLTPYDFVPGDKVNFTVYSYCKDWEGNKHFSATSKASSEKTIVSDKFVYLSFNGESFEKRKMYISIKGEPFIEIKKEKFKII